MNLTAKQLTKRAEMIEDAIQYEMNGWNCRTSTRNCRSREEAVYIVESLLSDKKNLSIFNAMAAAFA